jgi:hypothetical protein
MFKTVLQTTLVIMTQGETQADGWSLTIFINPVGEGRRLVVDRQKLQTSSEFKRYRRTGRIKVWPGRMIRQVGK